MVAMSGTGPVHWSLGSYSSTSRLLEVRSRQKKLLAVVPGIERLLGVPLQGDLLSQEGWLG